MNSKKKWGEWEKNEQKELELNAKEDILVDTYRKTGKFLPEFPIESDATADRRLRLEMIERNRQSDILYKESFDNIRGENSPHWRGGIAFEPYGADFTKYLKEQIRKRDDYTCQRCKKEQEEKTFHVHHIDYNKKNCDKNNLITLCGSCNVKVNANRAYWTGCFKEKIAIYAQK